MASELVYTSAEQGLKPRTHGFCTVAMTHGLGTNLVERLENMSGYRAHFPAHDPRAAQNPVNYAYYKFAMGGRVNRVLSRLCFYGFDYTGRSNKLGHHVVLEEHELPPAGPAALALQPGFLRREWSGAPQLIDRPKPVPPVARQARSAATWQQLAGDAGWAGAIAEHTIAKPDAPVAILYEPGFDGDRLLALLDEAMALIPPDRRWDVTFSTYLTDLPMGTTCQWRCLLPDSAEWTKLKRSRDALRIDLTAGPLGRAQGGALVHAARTGEDPYRQPAGFAPARGAMAYPPPAPVDVELNLRDDEDDAGGTHYAMTPPAGGGYADAPPITDPAAALAWARGGTVGAAATAAPPPRRTGGARAPVAAPPPRKSSGVKLAVIAAVLMVAASTGAVLVIMRLQKNAQAAVTPDVPRGGGNPLSVVAPATRPARQVDPEAAMALLLSAPVPRSVKPGQSLLLGTDEVLRPYADVSVTWEQASGARVLNEPVGEPQVRIEVPRSAAGSPPLVFRATVRAPGAPSVHRTVEVAVENQAPRLVIPKSMKPDVPVRLAPGSPMDVDASGWVLDDDGPDLKFEWTATVSSRTGQVEARPTVTGPVFHYAPTAADAKISLHLTVTDGITRDSGTIAYTIVPPTVASTTAPAVQTIPPTSTERPVATVKPEGDGILVGAPKGQFTREFAELWNECGGIGRLHFKADLTSEQRQRVKVRPVADAAIPKSFGASLKVDDKTPGSFLVQAVTDRAVDSRTALALFEVGDYGRAFVVTPQKFTSLTPEHVKLICGSTIFFTLGDQTVGQFRFFGLPEAEAARRKRQGTLDTCKPVAEKAGQALDAAEKSLQKHKLELKELTAEDGRKAKKELKKKDPKADIEAVYRKEVEDANKKIDELEKKTVPDAKRDAEAAAKHLQQATDDWTKWAAICQSLHDHIAK